MGEDNWEPIAWILAEWLVRESDEGLSAEELIDVAIGTLESREANG